MTEEIVRSRPGDIEAIRALQMQLDGLAGVQHATSHRREAQASYQRIDQLYEALPEAVRNTPAEKSGRAATLHNEAMLARDEGKLDEALELTLRAIALQERALGAKPPHPSRRERYANHEWLLAQILTRLGRHDEALRRARDYQNNFSDQPTVRMSTASLLLLSSSPFRCRPSVATVYGKIVVG